tara:strand:+ start:52597 stop:53613 length:1017 start_codon:yes stop_codon:yes gene_type:complete
VVGEPALDIALGRSHVCVTLAGSRVLCWGAAGVALGSPSTPAIGDDEPPSDGVYLQAELPILDIAAGQEHTCIVMMGGGVHCWGRGAGGVLGYGNEDDQPFDSGRTLALGEAAIAIEAAEDTTCILTDDGGVKCWGYVPQVVAAEDTIGDTETPLATARLDFGGPVSSLSVRSDTICAVRQADNALYCIGSNDFGALGRGDTVSRGDPLQPVEVGPVPLAATVATIEVGQFHVCAVSDVGRVFCWGSGEEGALGGGDGAVDFGDDEPIDNIQPVEVGDDVLSLTSGWAFNCGITSSGSVRCWGAGRSNGSFPVINIGDNETPAAVGDVITSWPQSGEF